MPFKFSLLMFLIVFSANVVRGEGLVVGGEKIDSVRVVYEKFARRFPQERVYLHFDNTGYFKGERIWYKANVVDDKYFRPTPLSRILYVELVSPNGWVVETNKHVIEDGGADGAFELKDSLNAGFYEVRAYTGWMLNFCAADDERALPSIRENAEKKYVPPTERAYLRGNAGVFSRVFPVYEAVDSGRYTRKMMYAVPKVTSDLRSGSTPKLEVKFYPEGGNLIEGIPTRVAYEIRMSDGKEVRTPLHLLYKGERDVRRIFFPTHEGRGVFTLPANGKEHDDFAVEIDYQKKTYKFQLPKVQKQGYSLQVVKKDSIATITVVRNNKTEPRPIGLLVACRGEVGFYKEVSLKDTVSQTFLIPTAKLKEGVNIATLFDSEANVIAQREFFVRPKKQPLRVEVSGRLSDIKPYEKVDLELALLDQRGDTVRRSETFSIAVTSAKDLPLTFDDRTIQTDLLLSSEIRGFVRNPQYYFEAEDSLRDLTLDQLLMVQGWTRYDFRQMTRPETFDPLFKVERRLRFIADIQHRDPYKKKPMKKPFWLECSLLPTGAEFGDFSFYEGEMKITQTGLVDIELPPFYGKAHAYFTMNKEPKAQRKPRRNGYDPHYVPISGREKAYVEDYYKMAGRNPFPPLAKPYDWYETNAPEEDFGGIEIVDSAAIMLDEVVKTKKRRWSKAGLTKPNEVMDIEQMTAMIGNITDRIPRFHFSGGPLANKEYLYPLTWLGLSGGMSISVNGYHFPTTLKINDNPGNNIDGFHYVLGLGSDVALPEGKEFLPRDPEFKQIALFADFCNRDLIYTPEMFRNQLGFDGTDLPTTIKIDYHTQPIFAPGADIPTFFGHKIQVQGFTRSVEFYSPDYSDGHIPEIPDFRRTLYWNPNVRTDANGRTKISFFNNSNTNNLNVSAEGITKTNSFIKLPVN